MSPLDCEPKPTLLTGGRRGVGLVGAVPTIPPAFSLLFILCAVDSCPHWKIADSDRMGVILYNFRFSILDWGAAQAKRR